MRADRRFLLLFLALLIVFVVHSVYLACVAEDAFIAFRYAKNLAAGHGLTWNAGEAPVEGYTNFLWVILSSLAMKLGLDPRVYAQILGIVAGMATMFYAALSSSAFYGAGPVRSLVPCLLLAVCGPFATWASSGMETVLFALLSLMSCYYFASYYARRAAGRLSLAAALMFIATLTRPEGLLLFAVLAALAYALRDERDRRGRLALAAAVYLIPFLVYTVWRYEYFGFLLPNTYYAKTGGGLRQVARGGIYAAFFGLYFILPLLPPLALLLLTRRGRTQTAGRGWRAVRARMREHAGVHACLWMCLFYALYIVIIGGDYMAMFRFFVPVLPFIYILFGFVADRLFSRASHSSRLRNAAAGLVALSACLTLVHSTPLETLIFPKPPLQHGMYRGVQTERWHVARLSLIGVFFDGYKSSARESIATSAIGAISYYAGMQVYDFFGLVEPHIAHLRPADTGPAPGFAGHEKTDFRFLFSKEPTYIMFTRLLASEPPPFPDYRAFFPFSMQGGGRTPDDARLETWMNEFLRDHYDLKSAWLSDPLNGEAGYFAFLELKERYRRTR